jgi:hypothetical protein
MILAMNRRPERRPEGQVIFGCGKIMYHHTLNDLLRMARIYLLSAGGSLFYTHNTSLTTM